MNPSSLPWCSDRTTPAKPSPSAQRTISSISPYWAAGVNPSTKGGILRSKRSRNIQCLQAAVGRVGSSGSEGGTDHLEVLAVRHSYPLLGGGEHLDLQGTLLPLLVERHGQQELDDIVLPVAAVEVLPLAN